MRCRARFNGRMLDGYYLFISRCQHTREDMHATRAQELKGLHATTTAATHTVSATKRYMLASAHFSFAILIVYWSLIRLPIISMMPLPAISGDSRRSGAVDERILFRGLGFRPSKNAPPILIMKEAL